MPSPSIQTNPAATPRKLRRESGSSAGPESQTSPTSQPTVKQSQSQPGKQSLDAGSGLASRLSNTANKSAELASHTLANTTKAGQGTVPVDQSLAVLSGLKISQDGQVLGEEGNPLGRVTEGEPEALAGRTVADTGNVLDENGQLIGRVETLPDAAQAPTDQAKGTASSLADLASRPVSDGGLIKDKTDQAVGKVVEGDAQDLVGYSPNSNGEILDDDGDLVGRVELVPDAQYATDGMNVGGAAANGAASSTDEIKHDAEGSLVESQPPLSKLEGLQCNKMGKIIGSTGKPVGELIEGEPKRIARLGATLDDAGQFWGNRGNVIGKAEATAVQDAESEAPFAGLDGLHIVNDGWVEDNRGMRVGKIVDGDPKKLLGREVDIDGDVVDQHGNTVARAEPWEAPDELEPDLSALDGKVVNKAGNVVDAQGNVYGRITSGDARMAGRKVDGRGQVWGDNGQVIGQAELIPGTEVQWPEGPFFGFDNAVVAKDGVVVSADRIIGRVIDGDAKRLLGRQVDEDGDIQDKNGNTVGRAERWEPEEKQRRVSPMSGRKVTREGEVRDPDGNLIGKLTSGNLAALVGHEIDDNGYVVDNDGNKVGECVLLENIPGPSPEELEAQKKEDADRQLATKMSRIVGQTLDRVRPICRMISERIEKAERTPKEELDEEALVQNVKPLLEEAGQILQECNGAVRAIDPDGQIAEQAKARAASHEASPEEHTLANQLSELTETVTSTIDSGKNMIADMPHAKKELNPLWGLLSEPLFQIIAAVGLLLNGVLSLVGRLLDGLGLGGLVKGLLGGLGLDQLLSNLGLTSLTDALGVTGK
ncbi:LEA domain protein [Aspergillus sp. HF37]|nr:LEA domain protein [Aspergillus sp. HF37]